MAAGEGDNVIFSEEIMQLLASAVDGGEDYSVLLVRLPGQPLVLLALVSSSETRILAAAPLRSIDQEVPEAPAGGAPETELNSDDGSTTHPWTFLAIDVSPVRSALASSTSGNRCASGVSVAAIDVVASVEVGSVISVPGASVVGSASSLPHATSAAVAATSDPSIAVDRMAAPHACHCSDQWGVNVDLLRLKAAQP